MMKKACLFCKIVGVLAIVGTLSWGLVGAFHVNVVENLFGTDSALTRGLYVLVGLSGIAVLANFFVICPACKKKS